MMQITLFYHSINGPALCYIIKTPSHGSNSTNSILNQFSTFFTDNLTRLSRKVEVKLKLQLPPQIIRIATLPSA